jgi:hypothetical protein
MAGSRALEILEALAAQLRLVRLDGGYNTDAGAQVRVSDQPRPAPIASIAIGTRTGRIDRTDETEQSGRRLSPRARRLDIVISASMPTSAGDAQRVGLLLLEDIEQAFEVRTCAAPLGTIAIRLEDWEILDRPDGIDAIALQVNGTADYLRK